MDYTVDFRILASQSSWPSVSLDDTLLHELADRIKDLLIAYEKPTSPDGVIDLAIQVDQRMQASHHDT